MRILDFLNPEAISANLQATNKEAVIKELLGLLAKTGDIKALDVNKLVKVLFERESLGSTGIGQGIGIPHGKSECVKKLVAACGISKKGINFDSLDGEPVYIFFLLLAPADSAGPHLKALARTSRLLKDKFNRDALKNAPDEKAMLNIIKKEDSQSF